MVKKMEFDNVNKPKHYCDTQFEPIAVIYDWLGPYGAAMFCMGNVIKYYKRDGKKDTAKTVEDLEKAAWYAKKAAECMAMVEDKGNK